jgi:hypothetical protein
MARFGSKKGKSHRGGRHDKAVSTSQDSTNSTWAARDAWAVENRFVEMCSNKEKRRLRTRFTSRGGRFQTKKLWTKLKDLLKTLSTLEQGKPNTSSVWKIIGL